MSLTKYERARLIGSRALQLAMGAPLLLDLKEDALAAINFNPIEIAKMELEKDILPISIKRPMPLRMA